MKPRSTTSGATPSKKRKQLVDAMAAAMGSDRSLERGQRAAHPRRGPGSPQDERDAPIKAAYYRFLCPRRSRTEPPLE